MDVILFGPPGAGKGTQASAITAALGIVQVATGDIFRRHLKEGTALGLLARGYMDRGQLVPDEVVVDIVASRLSESDCAGGVLLDGFPRTVRQAELLSDWLVAHGRRVDAVFCLSVPDEVVIARLAGRRTCMSCGATYHVHNNPPAADGVCDRCGGDVVQRKDDAEDTIRARLATYHRDTTPVLAWLRGRVAVNDIDGARSIEQVEDQIRAGLASLSGGRS